MRRRPEGCRGSVRDSGKFKAVGTRNPPQGHEIVESSHKLITGEHRETPAGFATPGAVEVLDFHDVHVIGHQSAIHASIPRLFDEVAQTRWSPTRRMVIRVGLSPWRPESTRARRPGEPVVQVVAIGGEGGGNSHDGLFRQVHPPRSGTLEHFVGVWDFKGKDLVTEDAGESNSSSTSNS